MSRRYLIDAQLPRRLAHRLRERGFDDMHTLDLPDGNATPDREINRVSREEGYVVVTKDADFVSSFTLHGVPGKLLLVSTGNITNNNLLSIFEQYFGKIDALFVTHTFIEISHDHVTIHT